MRLLVLSLAAATLACGSTNDGCKSTEELCDSTCVPKGNVCCNKGNGAICPADHVCGTGTTSPCLRNPTLIVTINPPATPEKPICGPGYGCPKEAGCFPTYSPSDGTIAFGETFAWKNGTTQRVTIYGNMTMCGYDGNAIVTLEPGETSLPYKPARNSTMIFGTKSCAERCGAVTVTEM